MVSIMFFYLFFLSCFSPISRSKHKHGHKGHSNGVWEGQEMKVFLDLINESNIKSL